MKLTIIIITLFLMQVSAAGLAQKVTLQRNNASLRSIFTEIRKQTGYNVIYQTNQIKGANPVNINVENASLETTLNQVMAGQRLSFIIKNNAIVIKKSEMPFKYESPDQFKFIRVKGKVISENGKPVLGATVLLKGSRNGTGTDMNGVFIIDVPTNGVLVISSVGYKTQEINVGSSTELNIVLEENPEELGELVIVGYGTQKKLNLTGALTTVKMSEVLGDRPIVSVSAALQGNVPGLTVSKGNGMPGRSMALNIRGLNSINGGAPLVLVDNVPMDIDMLNPSDIETVTVLKDAGSSAIYGARAAFGVILVTTKRGRKNQGTSFSYSGNLSFASPTELPLKASPLELVQAYKTMGYANGNYVDGANIEMLEKLLLEYKQDPSKYPLGYTRVNGFPYSLAERDMIDDMTDRSSRQHIQNISASGGGQNSIYRIGLGYSDVDGILVTDKDRYQRYNLSALWSVDIKPWLTTELDMKYANSTRSEITGGVRGGLWGSAITLPSYINTQDVEINGKMYPAESSKTAILNGQPTIIKNGDLRSFGKVILKPLNGLNVVGEYTFNRTDRNWKQYNKIYSMAGQNLSQVLPSYLNSWYGVEQGFTNYNAINVYATYEHLFNRHSFKAMGGFNQESSHYENQRSEVTDILVEDLPSIALGTGVPLTNDSFAEFALRGVFYRLNYSFADKYLLEINGRYDGSSRFPSASRFGFFPAFSGAWRISEEKFMSWSKKIVSDIKFRASWGTIGNQMLDDNYPYIPSMAPYKSPWLLNGVQPTTVRVPALVSGNFTWEKVITTNFGMDLSLFNNKMNMVFDWYRRDTKDMLAAGMELPSVVGAPAPKQNVADLKSYGWELTLNWRSNIGKDWNYRLGLNLFDNQSEITKFNNASGLLGNNYRVGQKIGEIWGYTTDRFYKESDFNPDGTLLPGIPKARGANKAYPGDILYKDKNGDNEINNGENRLGNPGDMSIIGNNTRRYQYGITGGLEWKDFNFSFMLQGVGKRDLWLSDDLMWPHNTDWSTIYKHQLNYWTKDNQNAYYPRIYANAGTNSSQNKMTQTKYLQNGAYLRLQNITVSYSLPKSLISKIHLSNLKVFATGENLHTWHNLPTGVDPEEVAMERGWGYPFMKQYSFGVNLMF